MCQKKSSGLFKNCYLQTIHLQIVYIQFMSVELALNNLKWLIWGKTQPTNQSGSIYEGPIYGSNRFILLLYLKPNHILIFETIYEHH